MKMALMVGAHACPEIAPAGSFGRIFLPKWMAHLAIQNQQICTFFHTGKCTRKWSRVSISLHGTGLEKTFFVFFSKWGF